MTIKLLLLPAFLLAACGDNLQPNEDELAASAEDEGEGEAPTTPNDATLFAFFLAFPSSCADHSVSFEGHYGYTDGTQVENPICRYELTDGTVFSNTCGALHPFPTSEVVVFRVTDPATGQIATFEEGVRGPAALDATLEVASNGLSISWDAHSVYDGVVDAGSVRIAIEPSDKVVIADPAVLSQTSGSVTVTEAGTYTVSVTALITFGEHGGCNTTVERTVDVICADDPH
ncbi:MAG TPA: hypothetical protein VIV11_41810 [Kofleriaceae bacterium]